MEMFPPDYLRHIIEAVNGRIEAARKEGYDAGQEAGYEVGFEHGHAQGYDEGYNEGAADSYDDGYDDGHSDGYGAAELRNDEIAAYIAEAAAYE